MPKGFRASYFCEVLNATAVDAGSFHHPCGRANHWHQPALSRVRISKCIGVFTPNQRMRHPIAEIYIAITAHSEAADVVERSLHERVHKRARVVIWHGLQVEYQVQ